MATSDVSAKSFYTELMRISLDIVWKDPYVSIAEEDADQRMIAEAYIASRVGDLNFYSVFQFHEEVLAPFFPDQTMLENVLLNKRLIPESMRDSIVAAESKYLIDYWENRDGETNEYYRMLFGLPPLSMSPDRFLYNTKYHDIDETTPLHQLQYVDRLKLENRGYFDELLADSTIAAEHPYLAYLGVKRVYPYIARQAEYYQLIYCPPSEYQYLRQDFMDVYEAARRMVLRVYYNDAYRNRSKLYEGFLGLLILFITQQRMCEKYLEADISRNFYDMESLRLVYDAYGVPFYPSIPLKYHERIVKHINELISYKGSTQVFYDVFGLFDFGKMDVFEYYLVKDRKVNEWGNPIFRDGSGKQLSNEEMWDLRFAKVGWKENKFVQVTDPENKIPYDYLTDPDPYWINDKELLDKLYGEDWNYFQSKYMGVQIMFELSRLLFETSYFVHMLHDNREEMSSLTVYYMLTGEDVPLFDMIIYALALLCRNAGYTGEIPSDPASVAAVYGFNFLELNKLLKMATLPMDEWVRDLKGKLHDYASENPVLKIDGALSFLIDAITDGAFNWLGADFPYGEWLYAPPSVFLHDFTPTSNTVDALREYLRENIRVLQENDEITTFEILQLYKRFVSCDNWVYNVVSRDSSGADISYEQFIVKSHDWNEEDAEQLRQAMIASYEEMLSYVIRLIDARTALTFDPYILELISNMNINSLADVERVYKAMWDLDEYITVKMRESHSKVDYEAFANLRKILMTTKQVRESVTKRNGDIASTYEDLLADVNPELYQRYMAEDFDSQTEEDYVIQTLMRLCDDLTLLDMINTSNIQRVVEHMFKILRFLKSAKVDLVDFRIMYLISGRTMNYIKLLSAIWEQDVVEYGPRDKFWLTSVVHYTTIIQYLFDRLYLTDKVECLVRWEFHDYLWFEDTIRCLIEQRLDDGFQYLMDWLHTQKLTQVWHELCLITDRPEHQYLDIDAFTKSYLALWTKLQATEVINSPNRTRTHFFFRPLIDTTEVVHTATPYILYLWDLWKSFEVIEEVRTHLVQYDYGFIHVERTIMHEILMILAGLRVCHIEEFIDSKFTFLLNMKEMIEVLYQARDGFVLLEGPDAFLPVEIPKSYLTLSTAEDGGWEQRVRDIISHLPLWTRLWETHMEWRGQDSHLPLWDWGFMDVNDYRFSYLPYRSYLYDHVEEYPISLLQMRQMRWNENHINYRFSIQQLLTLHMGADVDERMKSYLTLVGNPHGLLREHTNWKSSNLLLTSGLWSWANTIKLQSYLPLMTLLNGQNISGRDFKSYLALWTCLPYAVMAFPGIDFLPFRSNTIEEVDDYQTERLPFANLHLAHHMDDYRTDYLSFMNRHLGIEREEATRSYLALVGNPHGLLREHTFNFESWMVLMSILHGEELIWTPSIYLEMTSGVMCENVEDALKTHLPLWTLVPNKVEEELGFVYLPFYDQVRARLEDYLTDYWVITDKLMIPATAFIHSHIALTEAEASQRIYQIPRSNLLACDELIPCHQPVVIKVRDLLKLIDKIDRADLKYLEWLVSKFRLKDVFIQDIIDAYLDTLLISDGYIKTSVTEAPFHDAIMAADSLIKVSETLSE